MKTLLNIIIFLALTTSCISTQPKKFDPNNIPAKYSEGQWPPEVLYQPRIVYPKLAHQNHLEADVFLNSSVNILGTVDSVYVIKTEGKTGVGFEEEALSVARGTTWRPAITDGEPWTCWVTYKIHFGLKK